MKDQELTHAFFGAAIEIHQKVDPGLSEPVHEECLAKEFALLDIPYERHKLILLIYQGLKLECGDRLDFLVSDRVMVEIESIEAIAPIRDSVMLTHLRLSERPIGLLISFNVATMEDGIRRYVWQH